MIQWNRHTDQGKTISMMGMRPFLRVAVEPLPLPLHTFFIVSILTVKGSGTGLIPVPRIVQVATPTKAKP